MEIKNVFEIVFFFYKDGTKLEEKSYILMNVPGGLNN